MDVPRKGNVDRNLETLKVMRKAWETFPARGTWIEIPEVRNSPKTSLDVPRKGNVDRNDEILKNVALRLAATFPARGTWIEMKYMMIISCMETVDVPRKGNVDRNNF